MAEPSGASSCVAARIVALLQGSKVKTKIFSFMQKWSNGTIDGECQFLFAIFSGSESGIQLPTRAHLERS
jgi:hypothetical protein